MCSTPLVSGKRESETHKTLDVMGCTKETVENLLIEFRDNYFRFSMIFTFTLGYYLTQKFLRIVEILHM